jgi:hypothetical protein
MPAEGAESRSGVLRRLVTDAPTAGAGTADPPAAELGRVPLTLTIRPESLDWLAEVAGRCGSTRDVAARHVFSLGRRAVDVQLRRKPAGRQATTAPLASAASWPAPAEPDDLDEPEPGPPGAA